MNPETVLMYWDDNVVVVSVPVAHLLTYLLTLTRGYFEINVFNPYVRSKPGDRYQTIGDSVQLPVDVSLYPTVRLFSSTLRVSP